MKIANCQLNHLKDPIGFLYPQLSFSWNYDEVDGSAKESRLIIYKKNEVVFDTGYSDLDPLCTIADLKLEPRTRYLWQVSAKDDSGIYHSDVSFFETGKMEESWSGKWISCDNSIDRHPIFTKKFNTDRKISEARLYICGLGLYEARINGKKVSDEYFTPYCNNYNGFVQAQTYDVTDLLRQENTFEAELGNGWYKGRFGFRPGEKPYYGEEWKLIFELHIGYEDGTEEVIASDDCLDVYRSNIFFSNLYDGEHRDDTLEEIIERPVYTQAPIGKLIDRVSLPVKAHEILKPIELIDTPAGEKVFDFGQNMAGIFRLKIRAQKGERIHIQTGEVLQEGNFYRDNLRTALSEYIYISDGNEKILEPKFTFYGFRYVKVEGIKDLKIDDMEAVALYSDFEFRSKLKTGNAKIDQLICNATWGMRSNFLDVPTDCPQRDERMGWTGDTQVFAPTAMYLADASAFYDKFMYDTLSHQKTHDGGVPYVVPAFGFDQCAAAWGDVATILPMVMYEYEGDITILQRHYESMKLWVEYIRGKEKEDHSWLKQFHFGDWLALDNGDETVGATDTDFVAAVYFLQSIRLLLKAARILEKEEDIRDYEALETEVLKYIREEYYSPNGRCCINTQTAYLLTLKHDLSDHTDKIKDALLKRFKMDGYTLKTGFVGTPILLETLSSIGLNDLAYDLLFNEDYPGWLYCVNLGATTIWERWNSMLPDGKVSSTGMNSFNHYAFGSVVSWIYERAAGFRKHEDCIGFKEVDITPLLDQRMGYIDMEFDSPSGVYKTGWKIIDNRTVSFYCDIPYNTKAYVKLPYFELQDNDSQMMPFFKEDGFILNQGHHEITYHTSRGIKLALSIDNTLDEILANAAAKKMIEEKMPQMMQLPQEMRNTPLKYIIAQYGQGQSEAMGNMINNMLSEC